MTGAYGVTSRFSLAGNCGWSERLFWFGGDWNVRMAFFPTTKGRIIRAVHLYVLVGALQSPHLCIGMDILFLTFLPWRRCLTMFAIQSLVASEHAPTPGAHFRDQRLIL